GKTIEIEFCDYVWKHHNIKASYAYIDNEVELYDVLYNTEKNIIYAKTFVKCSGPGSYKIDSVDYNNVNCLIEKSIDGCIFNIKKNEYDIDNYIVGFY
ncbi:30565_t:CDS:1, partial [Gigaspora margarita]